MMIRFRQSLYPPALCFITLTSWAQEGVDPTGWWRATTQSPGGEISTTVRLDYIDGELLGSFRNTFVSAQIPFHDGTIDGNKLTFKLQLMTRLLQYEGEIDGDQLTLSSRVIEGEPFPDTPEITTLTLTRSD